jgi:endoglucanase
VNRRAFVRRTCALAAAAAAPGIALSATESPSVTPQHLPRWRGFNLLEKFVKNQNGNPPFSEADFETLAEWKFDFVRLPMSYLCWTDPKDWLKVRDDDLKDITQAVEFGRQHGVHVNLNFHRAPGYCVNPPAEPLTLWKDEKALDACAVHWGHFAKCFKGIPNDRLSFDLLNEPANVSEPTYVRVVTRLVEAIRAEDPRRLVIVDGLRWGLDPVSGLVKLGVAQSTRGYEPMQISHYKAGWINGPDQWPEPTWPLHRNKNELVDRETLRLSRIEPWKKLEPKGVGIHVGEWGAFNHTPHAVVLAWMRDCLALWRDAGWGWALWNLRGGFGVLDSERADVKYETFRGHKLDRAMLEVLQSG